MVSKDALYASYDPPRIFGVQLKLSRPIQFIVLTLLSILFSVIYSLLQERAFNVAGYASYSGFATFLQYLTYAACARIHLIPTDGVQMRVRAPFYQYVLVAGSSVLGLWANNASLQYIDYITKIVAKSIKVLPVFIFSAIVMGRRYTRRFYIAVLMLAVGLVTFLAGESGGPLLDKPVFNVAGLTLLMLSLVCDSLYANLEEKFFFKIPKPIDPSEILEITSLLAGGALFSVLLMTGEFFKAMDFVRAHREAAIATIVSAAAGYVAANLALTLIKHFGSGNTEIAKSMRKIVQVVMSILVFQKTISSRMTLGLVLISFALYLINRMYSRGQAVVGAREPPLLGGKAGDTVQISVL